MRVEGVAGELGEVLDVGQRHRARARDDRVTGPQLGQRLAERVPGVGVPGRAGDPAAGHRAEHPRAGLDGGALHVVQHAADAAHLLAAARPPGAAVHEHGQRGPVAGRLGRVVPVEHQDPAVPGRQPGHHVAGERRVGGDHRPGQAPPAARRELDHVGGVAVADDRAHRAERLHLVRLGPGGVVAAQQQRGDERAPLGVGADHLHPVRVTEDQPPGRQQLADRAAHLGQLVAAGQRAHPHALARPGSRPPPRPGPPAPRR